MLNGQFHSPVHDTFVLHFFIQSVYRLQFISDIIMIIKLTSILLFAFFALVLALLLYPIYIQYLRKIKAGQKIREADITGNKAEIFNELHKHKGWTPSMGWGLILFIVLLMVGISFWVEYLWWTNNSLVTRQETYMLLFGFFSMGVLWLVDDYVNIQGKTAIKGVSAFMKFFWMFGFSAFISYRFYVKLGIDYINLWPIAWEVYIWLLMPIITFFLTVVIVNAINFTDGLDGLAWWLILQVLGTLWVITFITQRYLATTLIAVIISWLLAFLRYNINPAKIFMGDSWALALGWIISTLIYLLNINFWIIIPVLILMLLFWIEFWSSLFQILWKKLFKKKLFTIAPFHHYLEHKWMQEHTIVMKFWLIQWVLSIIALLSVLYQLF